MLLYESLLNDDNPNGHSSLTLFVIFEIRDLHWLESGIGYSSSNDL